MNSLKAALGLPFFSITNLTISAAFSVKETGAYVIVSAIVVSLLSDLRRLKLCGNCGLNV
jgi:hypothetical protein